MRQFTIRDKQRPGSLLAVVEVEHEADLHIEEICVACGKQGVIRRVHPETEIHQGSASFRPFRPTAAHYRELADRLEAMRG